MTPAITGSRRASTWHASLTPALMLLIAAASLMLPPRGHHAPRSPRRRGATCASSCWSTLPLLLYGAARRYLQGVGQVRVITVTLVLANLVNWFGNWALIYGKLGLPGYGRERLGHLNVIARIGMAAALIGFAWRYERSRGHPLFATGRGRAG